MSNSETIQETTQDEESVLRAIVEKLETAKNELVQLAVQLSSQDAEPKVKFEEIKHEFRARLSDLKEIIGADVRKSAGALAAKLIQLETALLSRQVDAKDLFEVQKKEILAIITAIEDQIVKRFGNVSVVTNFIHDAEKFRLKLEILRLRFVVKKLKVKNTFRSGMDEAIEIVRTVGSGMRRARTRYRNFRDEIRQAYGHMMKAVKRI